MKYGSCRFLALAVGLFAFGLTLVVAVSEGAASDATPGNSLAESKIYWTSIFGPTVRRSSPNGSDVETLVELGEGNGIAVDKQNEKIYWTSSHPNEGGIRRSNLDGTNIEVVVPLGIAINPRGIDLDVDGGKMYWTDEFTPIRRADLDGSNIEDLLAPNNSPWGMAIDVTGGKMYWIEFFSGKIRRANLDGSDAEDLIVRSFGAKITIGLALDLVNGKMYWAEAGDDKIVRANLDGSQVEDVVTTLPDSAVAPIGVALDVNGRKVYWTTAGNSGDGNERVQRANLDGSGAESVIVIPLFGNEVEQDIVFVSAEPQNLNNQFAPLGPGDVATAFSFTPCGGASAGTFTITATFTNISTDTLSNLLLTVQTLTGGNVLCNANGGPGGAGATLTVPLEGDLADGQLSPGESFVVELPVGLQTFNPFTFLVDVLGEVEAP